MRYIVVKGYICLDGTSLTVVDVGKDWFNVTLVAYTQAHIVLPKKKPGDSVNIEVDVLGKYVERLLQHNAQSTHPDKLTDGAPHSSTAASADNISAEFLQENGFK